MKFLTQTNNSQLLHEMEGELKRLANLDYENMEGDEYFHIVDEVFDDLVKMQNDKGYFPLVEDKTMDSDCYYYYVVKATIHVIIAMIKAGDDRYKENVEKAFYVCSLNRFRGHGYDSESEQFINARLLIEAGALTYLNNSDVLYDIIDEGRQRLASGHTKVGFGDLTSVIVELLKSYDDCIFVYGTLMEGEMNHDLLENCPFIGESNLNNYGLIELNGFPGAIQMDGKTVIGEIYEVIDELVHDDVDCLESGLYDKRYGFFNSHGRSYYCCYYEYRIKEKRYYQPSYFDNKKWHGINYNEYVWYVSYGSNICKERFMKYIDKTSTQQPWLADGMLVVGYPTYFANHSSKWSDKGVAFMDCHSKGMSYCWKYLITKQQLREIHRLEGKSENWYNDAHVLGEDDHGISYVTFTNSMRKEEVEPSLDYLEVIAYGLKENYKMPMDEIVDYLGFYNNYDLSKEHILSLLEKIGSVSIVEGQRNS